MAINIDKENLEQALSNISSDDSANTKESKDSKKCCKDNGEDCKCEHGEIPETEEIGFHKGALNTLVAERNELIKMIQNIEAIMQAHLKRLEEMGVKIETQAPPEEGKK